MLTGGHAPDRRRLLLRADRAGQRAGRRRHPERGDLRPGRAHRQVHRPGRGDRAGQRHRVRAGVLPVQRRPAPGAAGRGGAGGGHGGHQPRRRVRPGGAVRRREAVRASAARARTRGCWSTPRPSTSPWTGRPERMDRRIFGLENEYGVTCTFRGQRRLSPDEVARYLFRRVVSWGRSSNVFLRNGARLYLDVGSHPEYATPECDSLIDLVTHDKAGRAHPGRPARGRRHAGCARRASPATSTCSRTTPTRPATPTAATRTTWSGGTASSAGWPTS